MTSAILTGATAILVVLTLLPLSKNQKWWIRGLDFPRAQLAALGVVLLTLHFVCRDEGNPWHLARLGLIAACVLYHAIWILPYTLLFRREVERASEGAGATLRIVTFNVLTPNRGADRFVAAIRRETPDLFVTVETDGWWESRLAQLKSEYPHVLACPLDNLYGMHLFSRLPLEDARVQFLVEQDKPSMHTLVRLPGGERVELHCLHPAPPSPTENESSSERDAELVMVGRAVKDSPFPSIVTGDLNDVAWSETTRLFRKVSGLLDPRIGRGMYNTFHAKYPFLRWPVDHIFHSRHFTLRQLRRLESCGSDHFPMLIELTLRDVKAVEQQDEGLEADAEDHREAKEKTSAEDVSPAEVHRPGRGRRPPSPHENGHRT